MSKTPRPVLRWPGGKCRIARHVIECLPPHWAYVEPFAGCASVLLQKAPSKMEVYNDSDARLVDLFTILRDPVRCARLRELLDLTPFSREEHRRCWRECEGDPVEEARRLIVRSFQSIGAKHRSQCNGWRSRSEGNAWSPTKAWCGYSQWLPWFCARLRSVVIECGDWRRAIDLYDQPTTVFYCDPPYPLSTRVSRYHEVYESELSDEDHVDLCRRMSQIEGYAILSTYPNALYERELVGWHQHSFGSRAQTNAVRTETLWLSPRLAADRQPRLDF